MSKKYDIIYLDPPWSYGRRMTGGNGKGKPIYDSGAADDHYPTMTIKELGVLQVGDLANDDCLMYMWVTGPFFAFGIDLMRQWGFEYKTVGFVWDKVKVNPGFYTMSRYEFCIIGKRGRIPKPRGARNVRQHISEKRTKHSAKPSDVRKRIEDMFPSQPKVELFAREKTPGWDVWGNEVDCDIQI